MGDGPGDRLALVAALARAVRLVGRGLGYLVALVLVALVPVVLVAVFGVAWLFVLFVVELTVGLPLEPLGLLAWVGLPATANGVPLVYPLALGVVTSVLVGWPSTDRDSDFSPPILPY